jgi:lipooligosaccharide transport system permease protein
MAEQHTYTAILATPCSVADIVAGDILWAGSKAILAVSFVLILTVVLGLLSPLHALALLPLGLVAGLMFASLGMVVTSQAPSYDFFNYYFTLAFSVMVLFSGVFFPLESLPAWAQAVAWLLPLTHAVDVARALAAGHVDLGLAADVVWIAVVTAAAFALAERLVRRRLLV